MLSDKPRATFAELVGSDDLTEDEEDRIWHLWVWATPDAQRELRELAKDVPRAWMERRGLLEPQRGIAGIDYPDDTEEEVGMGSKDQNTDAKKAAEAYELGKAKAAEFQQRKDRVDYTPRPGGRSLVVDRRPA
jgi:hypothetical protein